MIMMKNVDAFGIEEDGGRSVGWGVGGCSILLVTIVIYSG
jgi:hypothetical protein